MNTLFCVLGFIQPIQDHLLSHNVHLLHQSFQGHRGAAAEATVVRELQRDGEGGG